jgi:hypothetical protein
MAECVLSRDIARSCATPPVPGARDRFILIPKSDISAITLNSTNHLIVEAITIINGKQAYAYSGDGIVRATPDKGLVEGENGNMFRHRVAFKVMDDTPETKKELDALVNIPLTVVVQNNYKGTAGNAKYEVLGKDVGVYVRVLEDTEGKHVYTIELASKDGFEEPHLPANFFKTSESATDVLVEALLEVASA